MGRRSSRLTTILLLVAMASLMGVAVVGQRVIASRAFNSLEATTVTGDAHRVAVALSYETRLLRGFGATNSIWDSSYDDVRLANEAGFAADFPPTQIGEIGGVDAAVGIDRTGRVRTGGLVDGEDYVPLPADLSDVRLRSMVDFAGEAGASRCGLVLAADRPYLYCGFPARRSDSGGDPDFGLVYLRALDHEALAALATSTGLSLTSAPAAGDAAAKDAPRLPTELGTMTTTTAVRGTDSVALTMTLPTLGGRSLVLTSLHPRPIHATDSRTATQTFALMGFCLLGLVGLIALVVRRSVRGQVAPLRSTTEEIIASGSRELRVESEGHGEIAALGRTINTLLDSIAEQADEVERGQAEREQRVVESHLEQQRTEQRSHELAQERVDETVEAVVAELQIVLDRANQVQQAAGDIADRATATDAITDEVVRGTSAANAALDDLNQTLQQVHGIVGIIRTITEQTRMLGLNANIEAARAGEAGAGFRVVADEVRTLAADTATSAEEIATTTALVTTTAQRVARTLDDVTGHASAVGEATREVHHVVGQQSTTVQELADVVRRAVGRVEQMGRLSENLERRTHPRHPVFGHGVLVVHGTEHRVSLRDLGAGGVEAGLPAGLHLTQGERGALTLPPDLGSLVLDVHVAWTTGQGSTAKAGFAVSGDHPSLQRQADALRARYSG